MRTKNLLLTFAILFIALISGCAEDDFVETDGVCPMVVTTFPVNGATNVPLDQLISVTFNEEMNAATINQSSFTLKNGTSEITGAVSYSGTTAIFTPSALLKPNTTYSARITRTVTDLTGNALQTETNWTFSTGLTITPMVTSTDPANDATNVFLNKVVSANFNMAMKSSTITTNSYTVKQGTTAIAGTVTYSGTTAIFTSTQPLTPNTVYTATIAKSVTNLDNTTLVSDYVWKFTTGALVAPTVTSTDPINNSTGISLTKTITANFSMVMDRTTIIPNFTLKQGTTIIAGAVTYSGSTASFKPTNALLEGKIYTATITTGAKNAIGTPLANDYVWNFTTLVLNTPAPTTGLFFGVFGGNAGITNQGLNTRINNGGIGTTAASTLVTGFTDKLATPNDPYTVTTLNEGLVFGGIYTAAPMPGNALKAQKALEGLNEARALWNSISPAAKPGGSDQGSGELGGLTLAAGVYKSASGTYKITNGDLTLSGSATDVWIFQAESSLTVGSPAATRNVKLTGGALAKNVYWYVGSQAVINYAGGGVMTGNILAEEGVTLSSPGSSTTLPGQETVLNGRAISLISSVTMVNTIINIPAN
ncbi:Ig-like domain-containing protein [Flavobacterium sp. GT2N3]|uniref:Ig-like domain-containing protein n=1 Tax=unclassified Flavobacterium TaxID=196869 RepID=UPI003AAA6474